MSEGDDETLVDEDSNPGTYFVNKKVKGFDKKKLWSQRLSPDQERLEDECTIQSGDVVLDPYTNCNKELEKEEV